MEAKSSKAVVVKKFGGYDVLSVQDFPLPNSDDLIEVKVAYGGLNFADLYTRQGLMMDKKLPFVLGMECSGTITAIGSKVTNTDFKVGQKVLCYNYRSGIFRDVLRVTAKECYPLPESIDFKTGAAVAVNYLTAYFSLLEIGNLKDNESILILSCTGGVGNACIQLAKTKKNVKIFGTGSAAKKELALKNGIEVFFSNETFHNEAKELKFDVIVSNQAGPIFSFLQSILKPLGRVVLIGASEMIKNDQKLSKLTLFKTWWTTKNIVPHELITNNRVVAGLHLGTLLENDEEKVRKALVNILQLIEEKKINPVIDSVWSMSQIVEATKRLSERKNVGKVLISMEANEETGEK